MPASRRPTSTARVPAAMWTVAEFMRRQCVGPVPVPGTRGGKQGYYQPYLPRNPDVPGDWWGDRCFWSTQANLVWFAWGFKSDNVYQYEGAYLDDVALTGTGGTCFVRCSRCGWR